MSALNGVAGYATRGERKRERERGEEALTSARGRVRSRLERVAEGGGRWQQQQQQRWWECFCLYGGGGGVVGRAIWTFGASLKWRGLFLEQRRRARDSTLRFSCSAGRNSVA